MMKNKESLASGDVLKSRLEITNVTHDKTAPAITSRFLAPGENYKNSIQLHGLVIEVKTSECQLCF